MKLATVFIERCGDCPFMEGDPNEFCYGYCPHMEKNVDVDAIDEDCPLEDAP